MTGLAVLVVTLAVAMGLDGLVLEAGLLRSETDASAIVTVALAAGVVIGQAAVWNWWRGTDGETTARSSETSSS